MCAHSRRDKPGGNDTLPAGMIWAFLTTVLFSISAVTGTRTAKLLGGTEANFWRLLFATLLLGTYSHLWGVGLAGTAFPVFLLSGCIGFGGDVALFQTLPRLGSRLSILLVQCLAAPVAAVTEWLWLGTTLTTLQIFGGATILVGVAIALAPGEHLKLSPRQFVPGVFFGVLAALGQGGGAVISRKANAIAQLAGEHLDGINAAYQRIIGGVIVAGLFLLAVKVHAIKQTKGDDSLPPSTRGERWRRAWPWVLLNGLVGPALGVSCFQSALMSTSTGIVLPIVAITPLVIIPFAHQMEGERPSARSVLGGVVAVVGAVILAVSR